MSEQPKFKDIQQIYFTWHRPDVGFVWDTEASTNGVRSLHFGGGEVPQVGGPFLIESPETAHHFMMYGLLEHKTKAFFEFAATEPTEEGILAFANTYGMLTGGETEVMVKRNHPYSRSVIKIDGKVEGYSLPAESLAFWQKEIRYMKWTVQVWEWLTRKDKVGYAKPDRKKLRHVIHWSPDSSSVSYTLADEADLGLLSSNRLVVLNNCNGPKKLQSSDGTAPLIVPPEGLKGGYYLADKSGNLAKLAFPYEKGLLADDTHHKAEVFKRFKRNDLLLPARYLIQIRINDKLNELKVRPRLLLNEENELVPYIMPGDLLAAMWLQFYQTATGEKRYKRCEECGYWEDTTDLRKNWSVHPKCANRRRQARFRASNPK